jgi:hypothetical protein
MGNLYPDKIFDAALKDWTIKMHAIKMKLRYIYTGAYLAGVRQKAITIGKKINAALK